MKLQTTHGLKKIKPLFIWAGGKGKMIDLYDQSPGIPTDFTSYNELMVGGGAMLCELHNRGLTAGKRIHINDISSEIVGLYRTIKDNCEKFITTLKMVENNYFCVLNRKKWYYEVRDAYAFGCIDDPIEDVAAFFFLLKTSFNGIVQHIEGSDRYATPAGLLNQRDSLFDYGLIRRWSEFLQSVTITNLSWEQAIVPDETGFFFFDPPYRDSFKHYGIDDFDHDSLMESAHSLASSGSTVWVSNRYTEDGWYESRLGDHFRIEKYPVTYTAGRRKQNADGSFSAVKATEVLIHNMELK